MNSDPETIQGKLEIIRDRIRFLEQEEHDLSVLRAFAEAIYLYMDTGE